MSCKGSSWKATVAGLAMIALFVAVSPVWAVGATTFIRTPASAQPISNWYWLRPPLGASDGNTVSAVKWEFGPTTEAKSSTGCDLWIEGLVTNTYGGGSGHDKHIDLTLSSGGKTYTFRNIFLDNKAAVTMTDSQGAGYLVKAFLIADELANPTDKQALLDICGKYRDTGKLQVSYTWSPTGTMEACCKAPVAHHVAFNQNSMQVKFYYFKR